VKISDEDLRNIVVNSITLVNPFQEWEGIENTWRIGIPWEQGKIQLGRQDVNKAGAKREFMNDYAWVLETGTQNIE
jgi:hypothetical protein